MNIHTQTVKSYLKTTCISLALIGLVASAFAQNPPPTAMPAWEKSAALGLTLTRGNSDTLLTTGNILAAKKEKDNEISLGADATYGENNSVKNNEMLHGFAQYNRLFSERTYGYLRFDALHDAVADVEYRLTLSPGAGYYFIKDEITHLSTEAGPAFIYEKQGGKSTGYIALRIAEKFEHKLNDRARIWQSLEVLPQVDNFDNTIFIGEIGVEATLTEKLSLRTYLQDTYDNQPAPGREKNDLKLVAAVAYKF